MQNTQDASVTTGDKKVDTKVQTDDSKNKSTTRVIRRRVGQNNAPKTDGQEKNQSNNGAVNDTSHQNTNKNDDIMISGILDNSKDGHGVLRPEFSESERDAYIASSQIRRLRLRPGDLISGPARQPKDNERYWGLLGVDSVNDRSVNEYRQLDRKKFLSLTPVYPDEHIKLEIDVEPLSLRLIDLVAPIGKGQRSLIVSPPKAGKTTILKDIALGVAKNDPKIHLMAVLVGERPEEVTDIRRHIASITDGKGEVAASNFDESAQNQCRVAELALERAKRLVEEGRDVLILLDSITRLARAYNLAMPTSGRTLSGGFDPAALFPPKKFFGAARNFEIPGSLTIIGTALVDTGSRMDDLVYEEFKGTGNQELHLERSLAERRIYPAIDVQRSGTRRDDLLIDPVTYQSIITLHRMLDMLGKDERTSTLIDKLKRTKSNKEFLASLKGG
jgi:transcription termination factor Rho